MLLLLLAGELPASARSARTKLPGRRLESSLRQAHPRRPIFGVDDSGNGAIAGPIFAAAVLLPVDWEQAEHANVFDSKKMSPARRSHCFLALTRSPRVVWASAALPSLQVDKLGGKLATEQAMVLAVSRLEAKLRRRGAMQGQSPFCLVDGIHVPAGLEGHALPSGDGEEAAIAAASVVASAARDAAMGSLARRHTLWQFEVNGGHPSADHMKAIVRSGPCVEHRMCCFPFAQRTGRGLAYHPHRREYRTVQQHLRQARESLVPCGLHVDEGPDGEEKQRLDRYRTRLELMYEENMVAGHLSESGVRRRRANRKRLRRRRSQKL
ncbi:MAG: hypothetical protein SGPRY_010139 [Prymnesium sp.]